MTKKLAFLFLLLSPIALHAEDAATAKANALQIDKILVGTAIENKEIAGTATDFDSSIERLYCWTRVVADQAPVGIKHVWSVDGKKEAEVPLNVANLITRTWSSKRVWPGAWKVDVTDEAGTVLSTIEFTVNK